MNLFSQGWKIRSIGCGGRHVAVAADDSVIVWGVGTSNGELVRSYFVLTCIMICACSLIYLIVVWMCCFNREVERSASLQAGLLDGAGSLSPGRRDLQDGRLGIFSSCSLPSLGWGIRFPSVRVFYTNTRGFDSGTCGCCTPTLFI